MVQLRAGRLSWRELDGEIIALDLESSRYFTANSAATVLLKRLVEGATVEDLVASLVEEFDVEAEQASHDVESFLAVLADHDLLDRVSP